jgi:hypothetical protein
MDLRIDVTPDLDQFASRCKAAQSIIREEMLVAMRKSVLIVENQGKVNAPVDTGNLRRSIHGEALSHVHGTVGTAVPYAVMVHEGTRAHVITPSSRKALFWPGARHPVRRVNHPGTRPNPFLKRALAEKRSEIIATFRMMAPRVAARLGGG